MLALPAGHEALTDQIIKCAIEVHRTFGPGLLESVYQECLLMELTAAKLAFECDIRIPLEYKGRPLVKQFFVDVIVERTVLVEAKAVAILTPVHKAQVITYLKLTGMPVGLLINFNVPLLHEGMRRLTHPDVYAATARRPAARSGIAPVPSDDDPVG
jgi:GxxExxY protein